MPRHLLFMKNKAEKYGFRGGSGIGMPVVVKGMV